MSQTRRETLVTVLNGGTPTVSALHAMNAVPGVQDFLALAEARGLSSADVVDRLVAFKAAGGSGLQDAIGLISAQLVGDETIDADCQDRLDAIRSALQTALDALDE